MADAMMADAMMADALGASASGTVTPQGATSRDTAANVDLDSPRAPLRSEVLPVGRAEKDYPAADALGRDVAPPSSEEDAILVLDEEIETGEIESGRLSPASGSAPPSSGLAARRGRTPPPPRPRTLTSSFPPRRPLGSSLPPPSSPDPWLLANRTLELGRAHARIAALEEQIAYRDARITVLEERLAELQQRLEEVQPPAAERFGVPAAAGVANQLARARGGARPASDAAQTFEVREPHPTASRQPPPAEAEATPEPTGVHPALNVSAQARRGEPRDATIESADIGTETEEENEENEERVSQPRLVMPLPEGHVRGELQKIAGIGPRFEAALRKQGVTELRQIAAWSEADVRSIAKALKIPKSRILKGRWVELAQQILDTE
jgi:predicted flap endonuclease-1-like 5' DNA nuclease